MGIGWALDGHWMGIGWVLAWLGWAWFGVVHQVDWRPTGLSALKL